MEEGGAEWGGARRGREGQGGVGWGREGQGGARWGGVGKEEGWTHKESAKWSWLEL